MSIEEFGFGPEPAWVMCVDCGRETQQPRCWECERAQDKRHELAALHDRCNMPSRFAWAVLGTSVLAGAVKYRHGVDALARKLLESRNAIIAGTTGMGKTSIAVACLRRRMPDCMFAEASKLGAFGDEADAFRRRAMRAKTLLIDDLGKDQTPSYLIPIFDARYNDASLQTWVTTGLSVSQIEKRYDEGIRRRIVNEASRFVLGTEVAQ